VSESYNGGEMGCFMQRGNIKLFQQVGRFPMDMLQIVWIMYGKRYTYLKCLGSITVSVMVLDCLNMIHTADHLQNAVQCTLSHQTACTVAKKLVWFSVAK
jgi:hypothetical protein